MQSEPKYSREYFLTARIENVNQGDLIVDDNLFPVRVYAMQSQTRKAARETIRRKSTFDASWVIVFEELAECEPDGQSSLAHCYPQKTPERPDPSEPRPRKHIVSRGTPTADTKDEELVVA
jgi:hypothetical protein